MASNTTAMSQGLNKAILIGHLGRAPEMRYTPSGKPVTSFSIVTTYTFTASTGERREETDWFNIVVWGPLAEECKQRLTKGQQVFIEGRSKTRHWQDAAQVQRSCAEVIADRLIPLQPAPAADEPVAVEDQACVVNPFDQTTSI